MARTSKEESNLQRNELEEILHEIVAADEWPGGTAEEAPPELSAERTVKLRSEFQKRREWRRKLLPILSQLSSGMTFPIIIATLRKRAGIALDDAARSAHMRPDELRGLEEGNVNPLALAPDTVADLAETFCIPFTLIAAGFREITAQRETAAPLARSSGGPGAEHGRQAAVDDMNAFFEKRRAETDSSTEYLGRVRAVLEGRGVSALL